jgi:hypothetical protein
VIHQIAKVNGKSAEIGHDFKFEVELKEEANDEETETSQDGDVNQDTVNKSEIDRLSVSNTSDA